MKYFFILGFNLILISNIMAQNDESLKVTSVKSNSIGIGLAIGSEIGPQIRYELENKDRRKLIVNGQMLIYTPISDNILFDLGVGYGYPIYVSDKNALYLNGIFSSGLQVPIKYSYVNYCSSGLLEFEYRRNIGNLSINIIPFSRLMYTYGKYKPDYSLTFSYGMRLCFMYRF